MARLSARQLQRDAFLAKWSKVDWSKQNCELAVEMGLSGERIRQVRKQLGAPQPTHPNRWRKTTQALQWAKDNLDNLKGLTWSELQRKYGLGDYWESSPLHSFLKPFLQEKRKNPWAQIRFPASQPRPGAHLETAAQPGVKASLKKADPAADVALQNPKRSHRIQRAGTTPGVSAGLEGRGTERSKVFCSSCGAKSSRQSGIIFTACGPLIPKAGPASPETQVSLQPLVNELHRLVPREFRFAIVNG